MRWKKRRSLSSASALSGRTASASCSEGWAAGIYLTALAVRAEGDGAHVEADGRYLADYVEAEYLERLGPDERAFLRRTSVLEKMSGALCDAVVESDDSAAVLGALERSNLFLVPVDHERGWYSSATSSCASSLSRSRTSSRC